MFNFLSKPLILAIFVSLSLNGLFGYLSYHFYGERASALLSLDIALESNKALEKSISNQETACKIADTISTDNQKEQKELELSKQETLVKIDKLPAFDVPHGSENKAKINEENAYVNLDGRLPDELVILLQSSYHSLQRQGGSHAR
jgi:hypothetical protein